MSTFNLESIVRKNILELTPYRCARDDYSEGVLLDANENSLGPAVTTHRELDLNRYPDPLFYEIKEEVAKFRKIKKEQIFFGVGSDEAIDILFRIFCKPGEDNAVITPPTYGMYKVCAKVNDVAYKEAPLTPDFDVDIEATLGQVDPQTRLLFICSPGNPTSKVIPNSVVETLLQRYSTGILVVDEAYIDFSGTESACALIHNYPNVVVLQTLSKAFGLAGIRLGMCMGSESIIQLMNNVKAPYNINKLTAEVALDAFKNLDLFQTNVEKLLELRQKMIADLQALPIVKKIHHSDANFVLFVVPQAQAIYEQMADSGVVCRYRGMEKHCTDCIRVTVGTEEQNQKFLNLFVEIARSLGVE